MKQNLFKIYLLSFFILSDFIVFAQGPGDDDDGGGLEDDDPPATPINGKIVWLLILAIGYGVYFYNNHYKKSQKA